MLKTVILHCAGEKKKKSYYENSVIHIHTHTQTRSRYSFAIVCWRWRFILLYAFKPTAEYGNKERSRKLKKRQPPFQRYELLRARPGALMCMLRIIISLNIYCANMRTNMETWVMFCKK